jgi:hypothetical protein
MTGYEDDSTTSTSTTTSSTSTTSTSSTTTSTVPNCGQFPGNTLPAGTYQDSCIFCSVFRCDVDCLCRTLAGDLNSTDLLLESCAFGPDISNENGFLTCTPL